MHKFLLEDPKEGDILGHVNLDWKIILRLILQEVLMQDVEVIQLGLRQRGLLNTVISLQLQSGQGTY
jgi:hypothetical protein